MHPSGILTGGTIPAHVPGAYPRLSCCGGPVVLVAVWDIAPAYPTTRQLDAFRGRRSLRDGAPAAGGAFEHERKHGIGFRWAPPLPGWHPDPLAGRLGARRAMADVRGRAWRAMLRVALGDAGLALDVQAARETFEPDYPGRFPDPA